jgi:hypothetical protein
MSGSFVVAAHLLTTFALVGLIWFVQVVHYPMMASFDRQNFAAHEKEHCDRTGWVVVPLMLGEIFTFALLLLEGLRSNTFLLSGLLLGVIWASTFFLQVPLHRALLQGWNAEAHRQLVTTNWIRTAAWTGRGVLLGWLWTS